MTPRRTVKPVRLWLIQNFDGLIVMPEEGSEAAFRKMLSETRESIVGTFTPDKPRTRK